MGTDGFMVLALLLMGLGMAAGGWAIWDWAARRRPRGRHVR